MRTPNPDTAEKESLAAELRERVLAVAPGFVQSGELRRGRKSCLVAGTLDGAAVVAKVLLRPEPVWLWYFGREVALYQAFRHAPPPVRAPQLRAGDADAGVLVLEPLPGQAVASGRKRADALAPELRAALVGVRPRSRTPWRSCRPRKPRDPRRRHGPRLPPEYPILTGCQRARPRR